MTSAYSGYLIIAAKRINNNNIIIIEIIEII